jgi:predicted Rossmann-fold nucleotide-binding protein
VQTRKVTSFPVILQGADYWSGLLDWLRGVMLETDRISPEDLDLLQVTDDVDEIVGIVLRSEQQRARRAGLVDEAGAPVVPPGERATPAAG